MKTELPVKAQVLVYKIIDNQPLVLCLKRSKDDGGFWHVLTGTMDSDESLIECIYREINEEIGVDKIIYLSGELERHVWHKNNLPIWIMGFAVEISDIDKITLNHEHDDFVWLSQIDARKKLEKDSAKELLDIFTGFVGERSNE